MNMILSATKDKLKWLSVLSKFPTMYNDIYFDPEYISLNCKNENCEGFLFFNEEGDKIWINTFIKIKFPEFDSFKNMDYFDIETAYGYGGAISNSSDPHFIESSNKKFYSWVDSNNIISEFVRLHPLFDNKNFLSTKYKIFKNRNTCSLNLNLLDEKNLAPFKSKTKNMIRKAQQSIETYISNEKLDFDNLKELYLNSMKKKKADKNLFFTPLYFEKLFKFIFKNGFMSVAKNEKSEIISVAVFLHGKRFCHYHLSASKNYTHPGLNNLVIYNAAIYAKKKNLDILHLGGGNTTDENDKLFKFKKSMSTNTHDYYIGKKINNLEVYEKIKLLWKQKFPDLSKKYSSNLQCYHLNN